MVDFSTKRWQVGEIAFLKNVDYFNNEEYQLINNGSIYVGACNHPVIILAKSDDRQSYVVTTVSAYGSGPDNDYKAPWTGFQGLDWASKGRGYTCNRR
ncbi:hypothetical protein F5Y16DRAFT_385456 [Xylariaceae sp. FL0255]|nr:hypothetical protein F5Y16DRAFT_385456 [Xylariaceae sp. FL0255]